MRLRIVGLVTAVVLTAACQGNQSQGVSEAVRNQVSREIQDAVDSSVSAVRRVDGSAFPDETPASQRYADDTMLYRVEMDAPTGVVHTTMRHPRSARIEWVGEPVIMVLGPDAGVFTCRMRETLTDTAGVTSTVNGIWTGVYQRIDGNWKMVAEHRSYSQPAATRSIKGSVGPPPIPERGEAKRP